MAAVQLLHALVLDGVFMGAGRFRYLAVAMAVSAAVGCGVIAAVLPLGLGLEGVWWGITAFMAARLATLAWGYRGLWRE